MNEIQKEVLRKEVFAVAKASQNTALKCPVEWVDLGTDIGFSIKGYAFGGKELLRLVQERIASNAEAGSSEIIRVLEIGPGLGELVPALQDLGCKVTVIGEPHHIKHILNKYNQNGAPTVAGYGGWFPEAMPSESDPFDFIFASRVIHCNGLMEARRLISSMKTFLAPQGRVIVETTSPWASYYEPFLNDFADSVIAAGSLDSCPGFEVGIDKMKREGLTEATVALLTEKQAIQMFNAEGFQASVTPFLMKNHPSFARGDPPRWDQMLSVVAWIPDSD